MTFDNVITRIKSVLSRSSKDKNHYHYKIFLDQTAIR